MTGRPGDEWVVSRAALAVAPNDFAAPSQLVLAGPDANPRADLLVPGTGTPAKDVRVRYPSQGLIVILPASWNASDARQFRGLNRGQVYQQVDGQRVDIVLWDQGTGAPPVLVANQETNQGGSDEVLGTGRFPWAPGAPEALARVRAAPISPAPVPSTPAASPIPRRPVWPPPVTPVSVGRGHAAAVVGGSSQKPPHPQLTSGRVDDILSIHGSLISACRVYVTGGPSRVRLYVEITPEAVAEAELLVSQQGHDAALLATVHVKRDGPPCPILPSGWNDDPPLTGLILSGRWDVDAIRNYAVYVPSIDSVDAPLVEVTNPPYLQLGDVASYRATHPAAVAPVPDQHPKDDWSADDILLKIGYYGGSVSITAIRRVGSELFLVPDATVWRDPPPGMSDLVRVDRGKTAVMAKPFDLSRVLTAPDSRGMIPLEIEGMKPPQPPVLGY